MNVGLIANFIMDIKNWVYNWDMITFSLVIILISALMIVSLITLLKGLLNKDGAKFKIMPFVYLILLTTMLVLILLIRR